MVHARRPVGFPRPGVGSTRRYSRPRGGTPRPGRRRRRAGRADPPSRHGCAPMDRLGKFRRRSQTRHEDPCRVGGSGPRSRAASPAITSSSKKKGLRPTLMDPIGESSSWSSRGSRSTTRSCPRGQALEVEPLDPPGASSSASQAMSGWRRCNYVRAKRQQQQPAVRADIPDDESDAVRVAGSAQCRSSITSSTGSRSASRWSSPRRASSTRAWGASESLRHTARPSGRRGHEARQDLAGRPHDLGQSSGARSRLKPEALRRSGRTERRHRDVRARAIRTRMPRSAASRLVCDKATLPMPASPATRRCLGTASIAPSAVRMTSSSRSRR